MLKKILQGLTKVTNIAEQQETVIDLSKYYLNLILGSCVSTVFIGSKNNTFFIGANHIKLSIQKNPAHKEIDALLLKLKDCTAVTCLGVFGGASTIRQLAKQNNERLSKIATVGDTNLAHTYEHLATLGYLPYLPKNETTMYAASISFVLLKSQTLKIEIDPHQAL